MLLYIFQMRWKKFNIKIYPYIYVTNTNANSFIDNQIALTGRINQHKISYNDFNDQKYKPNKINNNKHYGY